MVIELELDLGVGSCWESGGEEGRGEEKRGLLWVSCLFEWMGWGGTELDRIEVFEKGLNGGELYRVPR